MELTKNWDYVKSAEETVNVLKKDSRGKLVLTTSKIRNILSMVSDIYNDARMLPPKEKLNRSILDRLQYLKIRIVYEYGRDAKSDSGVQDFIEKSDLLNLLNQIGDDNQKLQIFCHYMEALVAYHRYCGGSDK